MKLHDFGFWYQKHTWSEDKYSKVYSPGFNSLLFDGKCIAIKYRDDGPWMYYFYELEELVKLFNKGLLEPIGYGNYAFKDGYIPKPEDFEVIGEAP